MTTTKTNPAGTPRQVASRAIWTTPDGEMYRCTVLSYRATADEIERGDVPVELDHAKHGLKSWIVPRKDLVSTAF